MLTTLFYIIVISIVVVIVAVALFYAVVYLLISIGLMSAVWGIGKTIAKSSEERAPLKDLKRQIRYSKTADAEEDRQRKRQQAIEAE